MNKESTMEKSYPKRFDGKRILMLVENRPFPHDMRVFPEAQALSTAGYQVSVISPTGPKQTLLSENIDGMHVFRYPAPPAIGGFIGYLWEYAYSFFAMFVISFFVWISPGFDIIHAANPPDTAVFIALFYKLFGKRFIFDQHDLAPELYLARSNGKHNKMAYSVLLGLEKLSCRMADHVIATNQSYKEIEIQRGCLPEARITIVRNGPDLRLVKPTEPDSYLRGKRKVIIGYAGTMGLQDGVDYLLRALQCLIEFGETNFFCILVGDGDAFPKLRSMAEETRLAKYLSFTGMVEHAEVIHYLSAADICISPEPSNPYNERSTMVKMMEYMALGKPIVAFDLAEHRFTAQDAALYACPNDEVDMARQIIRLINDPYLRIRLGEIGRRRIIEQLAWGYQKERLLSVYAGLVQMR